MDDDAGRGRTIIPMTFSNNITQTHTENERETEREEETVSYEWCQSDVRWVMGWNLFVRSIHGWEFSFFIIIQKVDVLFLILHFHFFRFVDVNKTLMDGLYDRFVVTLIYT